jgi:hypothetical protein
MLVHCSISYDRVISSKLTRVFFNIGGVSVESDASSHHHQGLSAMVGLQDLTATDSLSREFLTLKQFRLNSKYDSGQLSNVVKMESLHSTLREDETVYWCKYLISSLRALRTNTSNQQQRHVYTVCRGNFYKDCFIE